MNWEKFRIDAVMDPVGVQEWKIRAFMDQFINAMRGDE